MCLGLPDTDIVVRLRRLQQLKWQGYYSPITSAFYSR